MWYSNDMFHYMFKAEFVTLVSLKVPSGSSATRWVNGVEEVFPIYTGAKNFVVCFLPVGLYNITASIYESEGAYA